MDKKLFEIIALAAFPLLPLLLELALIQQVEFKSLSITAAVYAVAIGSTLRLKTFNGICTCVAIVSAGLHGASIMKEEAAKATLAGVLWFLIFAITLMLIVDRLLMSTTQGDPA
ncbi:hypothetical protein [Brevundimonas sp.]|uniref:hypothetical protein n=1 Tax=Brevundimonas sp. TaxID=1871086 RepID=UPI002ED7B42C